MADRGRMGFERNEQQARLGDLLWDLHAAGAKVLEYTDGRTWEEFEDSELLQAFTRKMLELMADALRELNRRFAEEYARVPDADALLAVGEQTPVSAAWRLVGETLPAAVAEVRGMLEDWHGGAAFGAEAQGAREPRVVYDERPPEYEE